MVGDAPGYGFHSQDPSGNEIVPLPKSAVPDNGKVGNQVFCHHLMLQVLF